MKKFFAILLALAMIFALAACGGEQAEPEPEEPDLNAKSEGVMTFTEYAEAQTGAEVTVEAYVQAAQSWWDNQISVYAQDLSGGYFVDNMACTEEDAAKLLPGTLIRVTGVKSEEDGEIKITGGSFEPVEVDYGYIAEPIDVTAVLDTEDMLRYQNTYVAFKDMEVVSEAVYEWDNSGEDGDDLYFQVGKGDQVYTFMVESCLTGAGTDVYEAVKNLKTGDTVDLKGFCFWFGDLTPHITGVTVK